MESQYKIGKTYWFGEGVKQNVRLAKTYMHDAMEQGYAYALNAYGVMCLHDKEPEIQQTAISYFKQAVRRGFDGALVNLGELYYRGSIVNQDYGKAFEYFSQASESTSQDVKYVSDVFLAFMYYDGTGKENNEVDAMTFWQQNKLAKIPEIQSFLPDVNTLISERKSKFIADARTGDASSKHELAMLLETGTMGFKRDSERAAFWYCKAADKGFVYAFNCAASYYADGKGVEKDLAKALRLYVAGISGGDKSASMNLAAMLWKGKKVPKNIRYAYSLYISALNSENGIPQAQDYIGRMLKELKKKDRKNFLKKKIFPVSHVLKKIEKFAQNLEKKIEQKSRKNFDKIDNCEISTM